MDISELSQRINSTLLDFTWNEWAQLGVLAKSTRESPWAADPEALLVFSLQVARSDPRLFEEVLDWLALNIDRVSVQRLRNHYTTEVDQRLGESALGWVAAQGGRAPSRLRASDADLQQLFYGVTAPPRLDEAFRQGRFVKPPATRSRKSQRPDLRLPIAFAFRLRAGFGVGSRADVMRFLLTAGGSSPLGSRPHFTTAAVTEAAAYAKRNVHETLTALASAGWIQSFVRSNEHLYSVEPGPWQEVLWFSDRELPAYRDWTHALQALAHLHCWINQASEDTWTPYMLASTARREFESIAQSLSYAGIPYGPDRPAEGAEYWPVFVETVEEILRHIEAGFPG